MTATRSLLIGIVCGLVFVDSGPFFAMFVAGSITAALTLFIDGKGSQ